MLQVGAREEVLQRGCDPLLGIDLPLAQTVLQILGGQIDVHDLIRLGKHRVGNSLAHLHADQLLHGVVQTLQMLHIQRGNDVDACGENVLHVLISLGIAAAGNISVRQLVDNHDLGP